ncbi:hypothetical protein J6590_084005 [Homalodisca vitripennis]|nr:hypothetical protein J6590_084005 [Homalodisca vitripennis]
MTMSSDLFSPDASEDEYLPTESDKEEEVSEIMHTKKRARRSFEESVEPVSTTSAKVLSEDDEDDADIREDLMRPWMVQRLQNTSSRRGIRLSIAEQLGVQVPVKPAPVNRKAGRCSFISLQKKGWSSTKCFSTPLEPVPLGHAIKASKKKDVESLLKLMYGDEWKNNTNLSWYKIILEETPECHEIEGDEEECECDCLEPDVGLHI